MPIKKYKPMTPGRRGMTTLAKDEITASKPEKSLLAPLKSKGGRNNTGRITTRQPRFWSQKNLPYHRFQT